MSTRSVNDKTDESVTSLPDEPQPLSRLTGFQRDVLFVLAHLDGTNPNGVAVKGELRECYGGAINHGRLYQNLRDLVEEGLVEKRPVDGRTNAYQLSASARECIEAHTAWETDCLVGADPEDAP